MQYRGFSRFISKPRDGRPGYGLVLVKKPEKRCGSASMALQPGLLRIFSEYVAARNRQIVMLEIG
jgi:hypothetical protein